MAFGDYRVPILGLTAVQLILILYPAVFLLRYLSQRYGSQRPPKGYYRVGMKDASNVSDEFDGKYSRGTISESNNSSNSALKVKALFAYPIKSCAGIELDVADIEAAGIIYDRKFAFAEQLRPQTRLNAANSEKEPKWTIRTLRQPGYEKLVHVKPEIWLPQKQGASQDKTSADHGILIIRYPNKPSGPLASLYNLLIAFGFWSIESSFQVPLVPPPNHKYPTEEISVWGDSPKWLDYGIHVPDNFRAYIGATKPLTLFRLNPQSYRKVDQNAPQEEQLGYQSIVGFADSFPLHMLNLASVRDLAEKVKNDIPYLSVRRFRPNILVSGLDKYVEDDWKRITIGEHEIYCACHTLRCRLPNVDPDTSTRHPVEPDKTLKAYRCIDDGDPSNAALGLQLVPSTTERIQICVGDKIEVLERGKHHYLK